MHSTYAAALAEQQRDLDVVVLDIRANSPKCRRRMGTHSSKSDMAMSVVARIAAEQGFNSRLVQELAQANTVEAAIERLRNEPGAQACG